MKWESLALFLIFTTACTEDHKVPEVIETSQAALSIGGLFPTGVDAFGVAQAAGAVDPHYTLSTTDPLVPGPLAVSTAPGAGWIANTATSTWISGNTAHSGANNSVFTYTTAFVLAGVNPASASITGKWSCDDTCIIKLNGTTVATNAAASAWTSVANFTIPMGSPFQLGPNTLQFIVTNSGGGITGLQVSTITGNVGGCTLDAQCDAADFCDTGAGSCTPKLINGTPIPTIGGHTPPLTGDCNTLVGAAVCVSDVCDVDNACGFEDGHGPCTDLDASIICRSQHCGSNLLCEEPGACFADTDCSAADWCNETTHVCTARIVNGSPIPNDPAHVIPVLDAMCTVDAALVVCVSNVCDADNLCGYENGHGPCTVDDGATVCRSQLCATTGPQSGTCVACLTDGDCGVPTAVCDTTIDSCVQCTAQNETACSGSTPVCDTTTSGCVPCDGDFGGATPHQCDKSAAPYCFKSGPSQGGCGKCSSDADCAGDPLGNTCDTTSGACTTVVVTGCHSDADCSSTTWCNAPPDGVGNCLSKLDNGTPLPAMPTSVSVCTAAVGTRVCVSGVCDPTDNTCGLKDGDGPCVSASVCRSNFCDTTTSVCGEMTTGCAMDSDCPNTDYCAADGSCKPRQDPGAPCASNDQCKNDICAQSACAQNDEVQGSGILCAAHPNGSQGSQGALLTLALVLGASVTRRRYAR